jgi:hypothetical protein
MDSAVTFYFVYGTCDKNSINSNTVYLKKRKDPIIPNDKCHNSDCICYHNSELSKYRYVPIIPIFFLFF